MNSAAQKMENNRQALDVVICSWMPILAQHVVQHYRAPTWSNRAQDPINTREIVFSQPLLNSLALQQAPPPRLHQFIVSSVAANNSDGALLEPHVRLGRTSHSLVTRSQATCKPTTLARKCQEHIVSLFVVVDVDVNRDGVNKAFAGVVELPSFV
ncbi:Aste57867_3289 [Aphanomyces stellatus]|uniref:Aste57867_3289 protein n=1 Tax=Aphanomyces stellatus TaxID=120398 RepID=A0A485KAF2_9STRA|nr:hypothetical protein As57867_003279 [Aphanomyces stellatus]VFT80460.1 Aste57867_3289 [Aphanomyces stellatus]